jgi:hypothetical protein
VNWDVKTNGVNRPPEWRPYLLAALAMVLFAAAWVALHPAPGVLRAILLGCTAATVNGWVAAQVNRRAVGREMRTFLLRTGIGHGARVLLLLLAVTGGFVYGVPRANEFALATGFGYFCFLAAEIAAWRERMP